MKKIRYPRLEMQRRIVSIKKPRCPFLSNPFKECFIANINSQNIDEAIYYCGNNYEKCEIYLSIGKQGS